MTAWLLVQSQPNCERKSRDWAERQGYVPYLPLTVRRTRHARREQDVASPFFPRYLFIQDCADPIPIRYLPGVSNVVRTGPQGPFARVDDEVVQLIRDQEQDDGFIRLPEPESVKLKFGDKVSVNKGDVDVVGMFLHMSGPDRVVVLLSLFNSQHEAIVGLDRVQRLAA